MDLRQAHPAGEGTPISETSHVSPDPRHPDRLYGRNPCSARRARCGKQCAQRARAASRTSRAASFSCRAVRDSSTVFLRRAWGADGGLEVDSVARKGRDDSGAETFYVQAAGSRGAGGSSADTRTRATPCLPTTSWCSPTSNRICSTGAQLGLTRAFVARAGRRPAGPGSPGLSASGPSRYAAREVLPLALKDQERRRAARVSLTRAQPGFAHARRQRASDDAAGDDAGGERGSLGSGARAGLDLAPRRAEAGRQRAGRHGRPRGNAPGAASPIQRFGEGRSMVFTGEASWRWRTLLPTSDQSSERFWRQAARWLGQAAPDPVSLVLPAAPARRGRSADRRNRARPRLRTAARRHRRGERRRDVGPR